MEKPVLYYAVGILHLGVVLSTDPDEMQRDLAMISVLIPSLLEDIGAHYPILKTVSVYLYDSTPSHEIEFEFLGGATFFSHDDESYDDRELVGSYDSQSRVIVFNEETDIEDLLRFKKTGKKVGAGESLSGCFEGMDSCRRRRLFHLSTRHLLCHSR